MIRCSHVTHLCLDQVSRLHTLVIQQPDKHLGVQKTEEFNDRGGGEGERGEEDGGEGKKGIGGGGGRNDQGSLEGRRGNPHA